MRPMLATKGTHVPPGRVAARGQVGRHAGARRGPRRRLRLCSRNENDVTVAFPSCTGWRASATTCCSTGRWSRSSTASRRFGALADRMHVRNPRRADELAEVNPVTLMLFDLLRLDGEDLTGRRCASAGPDPRGSRLVDGHWQVPATYDDGAMLLEATEGAGLEGIVSKKRTRCTSRAGARRTG
jgi:bifunctional non-homologous end joining protein LigD